MSNQRKTRKTAPAPEPNGKPKDWPLSVEEEEEFWELPELSMIRDVARSCLASPWGTLGYALCRALAGSIGSMQGGGQGNSNMQQLTPSRMPPREAPSSPLAQSAEQRGNALAQMQQSHQQLSDTPGPPPRRTSSSVRRRSTASPRRTPPTP